LPPTYPPFGLIYRTVGQFLSLREARMVSSPD
jgi:hypothetical protein